MKKIFICSPYRGNVEENIRKAKEYSRSCCKQGMIPLTPHLYFTQFLDDENEEERELGIQMGLELLAECSEVWVFGNPSSGMKKEISFAKKLGIPVIQKDISSI